MSESKRDPNIGGLVLSRKQNETIVVEAPDGTVISFCVVEVRGDKVRLLTRAPKSWGVHRGEIFEEIKASREVSPC